MRKLFIEFFHIPKHAKIREKVMLTRVAMTVAIMIISLAAMGISAYAYFSCNVTSGSNIIKAANFETNVSIQITDSDGKAAGTVNPITSNYKIFKTADLKVGEWYTVTITPTEKSTAKTGFIIVSATGCNEIYHTQQLGVDESAVGGEMPSVSFELMITDKTDVVLLAHWGTSSYYDAYKDKGDNEELYITQGEKITMIVNGVKSSTVDSAPSTTTPSSSKSTASATTATTTSVTTGTSTSASATIPVTTEITASTEQTESVETTETTSTEEPQPASETTGAPTTEANNDEN